MEQPLNDEPITIRFVSTPISPHAKPRRKKITVRNNTGLSLELVATELHSIHPTAFSIVSGPRLPSYFAVGEAVTFCIALQNGVASGIECILVVLARLGDHGVADYDRVRALQKFRLVSTPTKESPIQIDKNVATTIHQGLMTPPSQANESDSLPTPSDDWQAMTEHSAIPTPAAPNNARRTITPEEINRASLRRVLSNLSSRVERCSSLLEGGDTHLLLHQDDDAEPSTKNMWEEIRAVSRKQNELERGFQELSARTKAIEKRIDEIVSLHDLPQMAHGSFADILKDELDDILPSRHRIDDELTPSAVAEWTTLLSRPFSPTLEQMTASLEADSLKTPKPPKVAGRQSRPLLPNDRSSFWDTASPPFMETPKATERPVQRLALWRDT